MNWRDRLLGGLASLQRILFASFLVFVFLVGCRTCVEDVVRCADSTIVPEDCQ